MFDSSRNLVKMAVLCHLSVVALAVVIVDAAVPPSSSLSSTTSDHCPPLEREGCETRTYEDGLAGRKCQGCALAEYDVCDKFRTSLCPSHTVCAPEHDGESQFHDLFRCVPIGDDDIVPSDMSVEDLYSQIKKLYLELYGTSEASPTSSSAAETSPSATSSTSSSHHGRHSAAKRSFRRAVKSFADRAGPCWAHKESLQSHPGRLECDSEGFYATTRLQCWSGSQCWCVNREGRPIGRKHAKESGVRCGQ